jgi:hypothetical protein
MGIYETGSQLGVLIFGTVLHAAAAALFALVWYVFYTMDYSKETAPSRTRANFRQAIASAATAANFVMTVTCVVMIANIGRVDRSSDRRVDVAYFAGHAIAAVFCATAAVVFYRTRTAFVAVCVVLLWAAGFVALSVAPLSAQLDRRNWCVAFSALFLVAGDVLMLAFGSVLRKTWWRTLALWAVTALFVVCQILFAVIFGVSRDNEPRHGPGLEFRWQSQLAYTFFAGTVLIAAPLYWIYAVIVRAVDVPQENAPSAAASPEAGKPADGKKADAPAAAASTQLTERDIEWAPVGQDDDDPFSED